MAETRINEDGEREQYCAKCQEWWPADTEFFYPNFSTCKACYLSAKYARRRAAKEEGCDPTGEGVTLGDR